MAREFAVKFYHSMAWKRARQNYIDYRKSVDGGLCEECHDEIGDTVHHKTWLSPSNIDDPEITLNPKNFKLICRACHEKEYDPQGGPKLRRKARYCIDCEGNIYPPYPKKR